MDVHHAQMSTFVIEVCLWYIGFSWCSYNHFTTKIIRKKQFLYIVSVAYPKAGLAENTGNVKLMRPSFNITLCAQLGLV